MPRTENTNAAAPADYVIIGAGSAGCALAYRLTEAGRSVTLIEFGGSDIGPFIQMPGALSYPMNMARYDWGFSSEPEEHLGGRRLATPRGKVLGGSSSINGMVFVRGNPLDYQHWEDSGATGWNYADVLPYFKRMETWHGDPSGDQTSPWRGDSGPMHVSRGKRKNPLFNTFIKAGEQAGWPRTDDYNGENQEGFGPMEATIWKGRRWSTANAYLRPAKKTGLLTVVRGLARRVLFEGKRAYGVELEQKGQITQVEAKREVIISASSINSPKLLMVSGIGPADHLREHGITPLVDRPGVGENLQDHLEVYMQYKSLKPITLYTYYNLLGKGRVGVEWLLQKTGLGASNQFESCGFIRSDDSKAYPDIQYHFLPLAVRYDGKAAASGHGFQAHVGPMRSASRGTIRLASGDPTVAPKIHFNYMSQDSDWEEFRACVRHTRKIFDQPAFAEFRGDEIQPGDDVQTDQQIDDFIREHAESAYHPCGSCRMGAADDAMAVVDPELRVIGVEGLRVVDSSIFPRITNGNLNGPSIMTGEKAADHILGRTMLREDPDQIARA
ncbi:choline dehydrogenase [Paracoccus sp. SM22M-07]|uniref:choline dehydrogenase n=1 Tax=Paracoccus sp. SM22M-07 TaxID=1520813 RepID=UPI0009309FBE|nr:choline dehydrogenase [Paracoccus sp. SM22M-07]